MVDNYTLDLLNKARKCLLRYILGYFSLKYRRHSTIVFNPVTRSYSIFIKSMEQLDTESELFLTLSYNYNSLSSKGFIHVYIPKGISEAFLETEKLLSREKTRYNITAVVILYVLRYLSKIYLTSIRKYKKSTSYSLTDFSEGSKTTPETRYQMDLVDYDNSDDLGYQHSNVSEVCAALRLELGYKTFLHIHYSMKKVDLNLLNEEANRVAEILAKILFF